MKSQREGSTLKLTIEGAIGESTPLFNFPLANIKKLEIDMEKVTSINSIGVKHWILWTLRIPADCQVTLINAPFVFASQASMVMGFVNNRIKFTSLRAPFVCQSCNVDSMTLLTCGKDFSYAEGDLAAKVELPTHLACPKCKKSDSLEPDFFPEKSFKFLSDSASAMVP